ncbi:MAG: RnfABCDGE type electron transport complex subunit D [Oscillospiraceae bacterium]|nr:RnfABCDGE type electron transport complex subunit D [Oscillospiraceae bacterium]
MTEKLMFQNAPHVRQSESVRTMMTDVVIALLPIYLMGFFYYGARALMLGLCGVLSCVGFSAIGSIALREKFSFDLTPVITGLIIPLLMPADIRYFVIIAASAVAIFVVKVPFGGTGNNLFNPAAVGFASAAICWPGMVFSYPAPIQSLEIFGESAAKIAQSPAYSLALGAVPEYEVLDMVLGNVPGPMGATNIFVAAACGIFLIIRKAVNWITPASFIIPYALLSAFFPRIEASSFDSLCYELFSGAVIFGAFFMLSEPVTSPKRDFGKFLAGITSAAAVFLFRYFGGFEMGFASALIVMNVFSPVFDRICEDILHVYRHKDSLLRKKEQNPEKEEKKEKVPALKIFKKAEKKAEVPEDEEIINVSLINTPGEELVPEEKEEPFEPEEKAEESEKKEAVQ